VQRDGIVLIDKEAGVSSAGIVGRLKRALRPDRIGHAGTLDPMATGLLVCLLGGATRLASFAEHGMKRYTGAIQLGRTTTTDDIAGVVVSESSRIPSFAAVAEAAGRFQGPIEQVPPQVSAVKIDGERAYRRARRGEVSEIRARSVTVSRFVVTPGASPELIEFDIECSRGTYIRSIARDLGALLGCGGTLARLRREASAPFTAALARPVAEVGEADILPWESLFPGCEPLQLPEPEAEALRNGNVSVLRSMSARLPVGVDRVLYGAAGGGRPYGLLVRANGEWRIGVNIGG